MGQSTALGHSSRSQTSSRVGGRDHNLARFFLGACWSYVIMCRAIHQSTHLITRPKNPSQPGASQPSSDLQSTQSPKSKWQNLTLPTCFRRKTFRETLCCMTLTSSPSKIVADQMTSQQLSRCCKQKPGNQPSSTMC